MPLSDTKTILYIYPLLLLFIYLLTKVFKTNPRYLLVILTLQFQYISVKNVNIFLDKYNVISHWTKLSNPIHIKFHEYLKISFDDLKKSISKK